MVAFKKQRRLKDVKGETHMVKLAQNNLINFFEALFYARHLVGFAMFTKLHKIVFLSNSSSLYLLLRPIVVPIFSSSALGMGP